MAISKSLSARHLFQFVLTGFLGLAGMVLQAQTVSTWSGGAGSWSDCPPSGNALWDTCPDPPQGLGWPNGNFDAVINGGPVTATSASIVNLTVNSGGSLSFGAGTAGLLDLTGSSLLNNGSISIDSGNGLFIEAPLTISGSGTITIGNNSRFNGSNGNPTVTNQQTIQGNGAFALAMNLINQGTINATGGTLAMQPSSVTNTATMEASSGGTLAFNTGGPVNYTNTGGTIKALSGGIVQMNGNIVTGGTLTTMGTGVIQANGDAVLNALTNSGTVQVGSAELEGTVTNTGTIQVPSAATLFMTGPVTLTGSGSMMLSGSSTVKTLGGSTDALTNQQLIHGTGTIYELPLTNQGTISADSSGNTLYVNGGTTTNTSTMKATGGGTLEIATVVNNSGGTIEALSGSTVILTNGFNGSVNGGTLTTSGSGVIESQNALLDGTVNIPTNAGKLNVDNFDLYVQGTVNNTGTINLIGNSCVVMEEPATLTGSGKLVMASTTCIYGSGLGFTNASTIQGAGTIGDSNPMPITNTGTITANNTASALQINSGTYGLTNSGKLTTTAGSTLTILGAFNSLSTTGMLAKGTYSESGVLGIPGAVVTNGASITLTGAAAEILNTSTNGNALGTLTSNTAAATLSLQSGQALTTSTKYSNAGKTTIGTSSSFKVGSSYMQTAGTTTVDGTLTAPTGMTLQKGLLVGKGTVTAAVNSSATVTAGDSSSAPGKFSISGSYTQQASGILNIAIGGTTAGTFGDLAISSGAHLGGTLNISLINGFVPAIGDSFAILTSSAVSGTFATVNGESINSGEHFQVNYSSTGVTLTVVSGP